ncbi:MAG: molybdenum cofactor guanylyltransferase, partial [Jiangellaceae bacterium]
SGPLAALAAGVAALPADTPPSTGGAGLVVVLAADLPAVTADVVDRIVAACDDPTVDGAVVTDVAGRTQPLLAAYRLPALDRMLATLGDPAGRPVRHLVGALTLAEIVDDEAAADIDTPQDLARWAPPSHDHEG